MKKTFILVLIVFMALSIAVANAGVIKHKIVQTNNNVNTTTINNVHNVLYGQAFFSNIEGVHTDPTGSITATQVQTLANAIDREYAQREYGSKALRNGEYHLLNVDFAYRKYATTVDGRDGGRLMPRGTLNDRFVYKIYWEPSTNIFRTTPFENTSETVVNSIIENDVTYSDSATDETAVVENRSTTTNQTTTNNTYSVSGSVSCCLDPVILDLNKDGKIDVAKNNWKPHLPYFYKENARYFDMTGDNSEEYTEWVINSPGDGFLVMPENGKVESALQLFGTAGGYRDGFEKLSLVCDKDGNKWIEGAELKGIQIWVDSNNDGVCQAVELKELSDYGIVRICTTYDGNFVGKYQTSDGKTHKAWEWWPTGMEIRKFRQ